MSIAADELNFLIQRHLSEAGYQHTAYMFATEAMLEDTNLLDIELPPQSLVNILQKGMLYMQLEKGINEKARQDSDPDEIITSLLEAVKHEEPVSPAKPAARTRTPPVHPQPLPKPIIQPIEPIELAENSALILRQHFKDVYCGAWSPDGIRLATGSADATAIIWEIRDQHDMQHFILDHATQQERENKDIATLAWSPDGSLVATGCYDGTARIWTSQGTLKFVLSRHTEPIFAVQFSPDGQYLLTGSSDKLIIVWTVQTGEVKQIFKHHEMRALDIDWFDNKTFASCSSDCKIAVCTVGQQLPIILSGHKGEVNKISWDPTKRYLASCSDDTTVRVWRPFERTAPIIFQGHTQHVYTIKWAGGENSRILASGSFDCTVRLWDVELKQCVHVITRHTQSIYSLSFDPDGKYFVSGGNDNELHVWRTSDAALMATYKSGSGIYELSWNPQNNSIAICLADSKVAILPTSLLNLN